MNFSFFIYYSLILYIIYYDIYTYYLTITYYILLCFNKLQVGSNMIF